MVPSSHGPVQRGDLSGDLGNDVDEPRGPGSVIIPSIDVRNGRAVQLVGGAEQVLDAGSPTPILERFSVVGETAVVDLDGAMGSGDNEACIRSLVASAPCRVGGGIRSSAAARAWLDAGAAKVVLGTAARPDVLRELPRERVVAALDARHGEVVVDGWTRGTGRTVTERMHELRSYVGGFLVTFVEREGRMEGLDLSRVPDLVAAAAPARLTVAGGVTTAADVAALDRMGADAQVGMALYTGRLTLGAAVAAPLVSDRPDGAWPTVVVDAAGTVLGLAYSNEQSLGQAIDERRGVYWSRRRGLWVKGATSGAEQTLRRVALDCDRDALRFTVVQHGSGFCHDGTWTCWGDDGGLGGLARRLAARVTDSPDGSYTRRLLDDADLLAAKLVEEAAELAAAREPGHVAAEVADVLYFSLVAMVRAGVAFDDVIGVLERRRRQVTRRPGNAKPGPSSVVGEQGSTEGPHR